MITRYDVLGVSEHATLDEIERAYKRITIYVQTDRHAPGDADGWRNPWPARILELAQQARETLCDPERRAEYDAGLRAFRSSQTQQRAAVLPTGALSDTLTGVVADMMQGGIDSLSEALKEGVESWKRKK